MNSHLWEMSQAIMDEINNSSSLSFIFMWSYVYVYEYIIYLHDIVFKRKLIELKD